MKVGFIGLGLMGSGMARNLMKAGYDLVVHNRSREIVDELVSEGAAEAWSPREVAEQVDIVMTCLPDSPDVEKVALGEDGIIEGVREGMIFVDHSTIKPETARMVAEKFAEAGVMALDAPISGGDIGAREGTLSIMVGGPEEAFEKALPLFQAMGKTITLVGESGAGQVAKACNQVVVAGTMAAMAEALVLAVKAGANPAKVVQAISRGAAQCWALDHKPQRIFKRELGPGFKAYMQHKDLNIVLDTGNAYGVPLPVTGVVQQLFRAMLAMGNGELDNAAVITVIEALADVVVEAE
jgi:2-hydroxy-3-oxopropionate reductase